MSLVSPIVREPDPAEIDPGPCQMCGRTIDEHFRVDTFEGPLFLCEDALFAGDLVCQWELADAQDRWRHTGEPAPSAAVRNSDISARPANKPRPYSTPDSTIAAFFYVIKTKDAAGIAAWLADHPRDETYLRKILEQKCSTAPTL
jgi:hypothetical protein